MQRDELPKPAVKLPLIIVVDDDPMLRMLMRESLEQSDFIVAEACDGKEALDLFNELHPDIVLLDVEMPVMGGYTACAEIRSLDSGKHTPIIMVTGLEDTESVDRAYQVGATDFITKPINWAILGHRVRYILRGARLFNELKDNKHRLATAQRIARMGNWEWDIEEDIFYWSDELCDIFATKVENNVSSPDSFINCIHEDDKEIVRNALAKKKPYDIEFRIPAANGTIRIFHNQAEVAMDEEGKLIRVFGIIQDITGRRQAEQREARLGRILNASGSEILVFNGETLCIMEANLGAQRNTGYSLDELATMNPLDLMVETDSAYFDSLILPLRDKSQDQVVFEMDLRRKDSSTYTAELCLQLSHMETPSVFFAVIQDITERKKIEERIRHLAYYDKLTDLPNRGLFTEILNQAIRYAQRYSKRIATLFLDLDRFKQINDTLGHSVGDALLKEVAERLKPCLRSSDSVARLEPENKLDLVSRFGGDEFLMLLTELKKVEDAAVIARRILAVFETPFNCAGHEFRITVSIGISVFPDDGDNPEDLVKNADSAMYHAKKEGRNNFQFYNESMNVRSLQKFTMEADLRKALEREEFILHYQPQVDIKTGRIVGAEALIRWMHPERGLISPVDFIPLAEETGLILSIGDWVMRTACAQQQAWVSEGYDALRVSVNLSIKQLRQNTIIELINRLKASKEIDTNYLELELTESAIMQDAVENIKLLNTIKGMGIRLSIDDFGTGYSSLSYLQRLPLDTLKIDRSFINDIATDPDSAAIVKAIISMSRSLHLQVVAEGVETEQQLAFLREHGCDVMQGYYFSKPVPPDEFTKLVIMNRLPSH